MKFIEKMFKSKMKSSASNSENQKDVNHIFLSKSLEKNINLIKKTLGESSDIVIREFFAGEDGKIKIGVIYTDGLADKTLVQTFILEPLMLEMRKTNLSANILSKKNSFEILKNYVIPKGDMKDVSDFEYLFTQLLSGNTIILIDSYNKGIAVDSRGWESRDVTEPTSQTVIRGPKEGFTETLRTNTALIRRKIKDPSLRIEAKQIGRRTKTDICIIFIKGVANDKIVKEVHKRLDRIDIDGILESGYIEELIQDEVYTPFPTMINTERPDSVAANLLEGRIAILVDGTPFVLIVPALFTDFFKSAEDYYHRFCFSSLVRIIRYFSFFITLLTPSIYVAVTTFHQEMLPTPLLISIAAQREGVPFPAVFEALLMELAFEILREAGVRMPRAAGAAISIVGALVLGEAAVMAGIVSPAMVIVVSLTAISSFVIPSYNLSITIRILRFLFMILGATFGLYGISLGLIALVLHLCSLRSFGIPYMAPMAPFNLDDQRDTIFRLPHYRIFSRPHLISQKNIIRQQSPLIAKPTPPKDYE